MVRRNIGYSDPETRKELTKQFAVSCFDQINDLPEIKDLCPEYLEIGSMCCKMSCAVGESDAELLSAGEKWRKAGYPGSRGDPAMTALPSRSSRLATGHAIPPA